jgi:rare lipoprotein A (peptidoglycan hydrolase)
MMSKHIATAFIAASALLAATSHGAFARSSSHPGRPAHVARAAHAHTHVARTVRASHTVRTAHAVRSVHVVRTAAVQETGSDDAVAWIGESGTASYYGPGYHGRRSASGTRFDQMALTAAHPWLPFGTKVRVVLAGTDRSVIVTITDRLYSSHRVVDLSVAAARQLGIISRGVAQVSLHPA